MAAVLTAAPGAVLSHRSAAALWGLVDAADGAVDVTVPRATGRVLGAVRVHSAATLQVTDITACDGVPCTAVPRTLLDLAATVDRRTLERAVDRAEELRVFNLRAIEDVLARNRGGRGTGALGSLLADYSAPADTRSQAEERFLALAKEAGLPPPKVNEWLALPDGGGYRPDFLWPAARLIVEVDGRRHHARHRAFEHDRRRDRRLALAGFETRRYAATEITRDAERVIREVRAFLAAAGAQRLARR